MRNFSHRVLSFFSIYLFFCYDTFDFMLLCKVIQVEMDDIHIDIIYNLDGFSRTRISNPIDSFSVRVKETHNFQCWHNGDEEK